MLESHYLMIDPSVKSNRRAKSVKLSSNTQVRANSTLSKLQEEFARVSQAHVDQCGWIAPRRSSENIHGSFGYHSRWIKPPYRVKVDPYQGGRVGWSIPGQTPTRGWSIPTTPTINTNLILVLHRESPAAMPGL